VIDFRSSGSVSNKCKLIGCLILVTESHAVRVFLESAEKWPFPSINIYLVGGFNPSKQYESQWQLGWLFPIYGKIRFMFQTTNQIYINIILYIIRPDVPQVLLLWPEVVSWVLSWSQDLRGCSGVTVSWNICHGLPWEEWGWWSFIPTMGIKNMKLCQTDGRYITTREET
jgi:hypothetical protein